MNDTRRAAILLTGASGFVGSRLAPLLAATFKGQRLVALTANPPPGWIGAPADITDAAQIEALIAQERPCKIVHLAAQSSVGAANGVASATWRVNAIGAFALANAVARHSPDATLLFASSAEVYGDAFLAGPVDEDAPPQPKNPYARSKLAAEGIFADLLSPTNQLIVGRAFNHTGAGQDARFVLPSFAQQIAAIEANRHPPVLHVGNLDAERDFMDVDDVCDAYCALLMAKGLPTRATFNIASGEAHSIRSLLLRLKALARVAFTIEVDSARMRPNDIPRAVGRNNRIIAATGWSPRRLLDPLLQSLLDAARQTVSIPLS